MPEVTSLLATRAHPLSEPQWYLTEEAIAAMCASLIGKPVRMNFQGEAIGEVTAVQRVEEQVWVTVSIGDPTLAAFVQSDAYSLGPAMQNDTVRTGPIMGELPMGTAWKVQQIGVIREPADPEPSDDVLLPEEDNSVTT
jgi:hypothetical protein